VGEHELTCGGSVAKDLKPENVLICIDDVESIIEAELAAQSASAQSAPTRLVGVPPSRGRGGNQTPRSESVFITGSQPLPSPSSSYGSTSHLDRWAFSMSKIDADGPSKPGSLVGGSLKDNADTLKATASSGGSQENRSNSMEQATERIQNVKLETSPFGEKVRPGKAKMAGPSLLSQQAPGDGGSSSTGAASSNPPPYSDGMAGNGDENGGPNLPSMSTSAMSVDANMPFLEGTEKITVKIADLGNGEYAAILFRFHWSR
jgi:serine/threonine-protein kinase SRPK3